MWYSNLEKNIYFSTSPALIHMSHRFTNVSATSAPQFQPLRHQRNHQATKPTRRFFSGPNTWKSLGATAGQLGGCSRSSHCSSWILSWVTWATWGLSLPWWSSTPLASWPGRFLQIVSRSFNITSQRDAEFTFSPRFWKSALRIPKHSKHNLLSW
jgi:hypothetical protein